MVIPFSNTKLRVPKGFQSLLVNLSTEILRTQPRNIHEFAADYLQKLVERRDQGESILPDKQTALEDRYYNNQTFQEDYPVNDPDVQHAATKIQAQFRGHKARQNVEKMKHDNKEITDTDQQELGYGREHSAPPKEDEHHVSHDEHPQKAAHATTAHTEQAKSEKEPIITKEPDQHFDEEITEEEKQEQERAARSIQARFRGHKDRKSAGRERAPPAGSNDHDQSVTHDKASLPSTAHPDTKQDSDHHGAKSDRAHHDGKHESDHHAGKSDHDHEKNSKHDDRTGTGEHHDTHHPSLHREPTQLSEDFERHTQVPRDSDFHREQRPDLNNATDDDDMNDSNLDKAATRIQASFRGYKTRKELGAPGSQDQHPSSTSSHPHDEDDHAHHKVLSSSAAGNKEPEGDEDDNTAAIKIQAAYRGYRVRKDLEK